MMRFPAVTVTELVVTVEPKTVFVPENALTRATAACACSG